MSGRLARARAALACAVRTCAVRARAALACAALAGAALAAPTAPHAAAAQTPAPGGAERRALEQRIDAEQRLASGRAVLAAGHVDLGPRFLDGGWRVMIHDDAAAAHPGRRSVWRLPERTVLRVGEGARRPAPEDPAYRFLHAEPGSPVYVLPQTQDPDVVWLGWNTQDPRVMERIERGVTMTLAGVQGPGALVVFLQSGDLAAPQVLWDSTGPPRPAWVDVNTHTHANWVFTAPGVYLVRVTVSADLLDGSAVSDTRTLRFAVGDDATPAQALAARWRGAAPTAPTAAEQPATAPAAADGGPDVPAAVLIALAAVALGAAAAAARVRAVRVRRRARARARDDEARGAGR